MPRRRYNSGPSERQGPPAGRACIAMRNRWGGGQTGGWAAILIRYDKVNILWEIQTAVGGGSAMFCYTK